MVVQKLLKLLQTDTDCRVISGRQCMCVCSYECHTVCMSTAGVSQTDRERDRETNCQSVEWCLGHC